MTIREDVLRGAQVLGAMVFEFYSPGMAQILAHAGCRYVIYDMEHSGVTLETLKGQAAAARGLDIAPMARVPRGEYHFIARALDIGMKGIMVPMVESAAEASSIVEATRYPPLGRRGAAFGFAHDDYAPGDPAEKLAKANAETLVIAQIETERGLARVDEIAAVDGVDVLWIGHFDLTNFLGTPGDFESDAFLDAVSAVVRAARKYDKGLGFLASDAATAEKWRGMGFNMLAAGTDHGLLGQAVRGVLDPVREG